MKTYNDYIITRPWIQYHVRYDVNKVMGVDENYGNPLDSPIITDLVYSIDILTNRVRKTNNQYSKKRYVDILFEMEGDLNYYLRCPRKRYLDDLLYMDREPNKWKKTNSIFYYCISDVESLSEKTAIAYVQIVDQLKEDFTLASCDLDIESIYELSELGYILFLPDQTIMINPALVQGGTKNRFSAELIWKENVKKESMEHLLTSKNIRIYGMEKVPEVVKQDKDFISIEELL